MSYKVHPKELIAVQALAPEKRYEYLINKIADWEEVWSIGDDDGWVLLGDETGTELIPIWPAEAFATACCVLEWQNEMAKSISVSDWMNKWTPEMIADGRKVAVFPLPNHKGMIVEPARLAGDIQEWLDEFD
jgi:uncharacterized protein DUF2750